MPIVAMTNSNNTDKDEKEGPIVLRDHLAAHRTDLANDRTFLAYVRTALTFAVVGATFIKFFGNPVIEGVGWVFIPAGIFIFLKGLQQFRKTKSALKKEERNPPTVSDI